jgi:hypothetical protein
MPSFKVIYNSSFFLTFWHAIKNINSSWGGKWSTASFATILALGVADAYGYDMQASFLSFAFATFYLCLPGLLSIRHQKTLNLLDDCASLGNKGVIIFSIYALCATYIFDETFPKRVVFFCASAPLFVPLLLRI